jgi:hypothetical protein
LKSITIAYFITLLTLSNSLLASVLVTDPVRLELRERLIDTHMALTDWKDAKHFLLQELYIQEDSEGYFLRDVYCHHIIRKNVSPDTMPDGKVINIEHTWPQSKFPKRKSKVQKSDLHHLFPTDSNTNNERANHTFYNLVKSSPMTECPTSKLGYNRPLRQMSFEPPTEHKGNVARALFYFAIRYKGHINDTEEAVLRLWNLLDPVDDEEIRRNDLIESKQGNRNIFIDDPSLVDKIQNF